MNEGNDTGVNMHEVLKQSLKDDFERTLDDRCERLGQAKNLGIVPYGVFGAPSVECINLFRDGQYYGCISLIQAVTEAIVRHVWKVKLQKKATAEGEFEANLNSLNKKGFISDDTAKKTREIWKDRHSFHHLKLNVETGHRQLETMAAEKLQLLAEVEEDFFGDTIHDGLLNPTHPEFWNPNKDGEVLVYMRGR